MKKIIAAILAITFAVLPVKLCFASDMGDFLIDESELRSVYEEFEDIGPPTEDEVYSYIANKIIYKNMNYQGENDYWIANMVLEETLTEDRQVKYNIVLTLTPKVSAIDWIKVSLVSYNGIYCKNEWQIFRNPLKFTFSDPIPAINEQVVLVTTQNSTSPNIMFLSNMNQPEGMISSEQAIRIFIQKYYETFREFPPADFTYEISVYGKYWLITFDDNDGIGGKSCLLIDGVSGEASDIKTDE